MARTVTVPHPDAGRAVWDAQVAFHPAGHVLQGWAWGELKSRFGWQVDRLALPGATSQVLYRPLPGGLGAIAYVPKGPLLDWGDRRAVEDWLGAVRPRARSRRAICLKIEPNLDEDPALAAGLCAYGFRPSAQAVQPRRTLLVDLAAGPDELLARMKQKTRYNIRLAGRKGVAARAGTEADLPAFYRLMAATAHRDGFAIHSPAYYEAAHRLFVPEGQGCLLLAEFEGQLLAGLVVLALGASACYMYGASSDAHRELMAPYLLQWEAMRWAKERGCRIYDLWGVPDEEEDVLEAQFTRRSDGLWGVYRFKRGFGGRLSRTAGAWDLVYDPVRYRLYGLALALRERAVALAARRRPALPAAGE